MNYGKAMAIFIQIDSDKYSDIEKALAIHQVMKAPTHMAIKKDDMLRVIDWLWNKLYEIQLEEDAPDTNVGSKPTLPEDIKQTVLDSFMKGSED